MLCPAIITQRVRLKCPRRSTAANGPLLLLPAALPRHCHPPLLLLQYAVYRKPMVFNAICKLAMLLSTAMLILGVVLVWLRYPTSYNYQQARDQPAFLRLAGSSCGLYPPYRRHPC